jgi:hypothetical protein
MTRFVANKGRPTMSLCRTFSTFSRLAGALAALWLCGAGAAWAGDGGDLGSLQNVTNGFCAVLNMKTCPQLPTVTQGVLEVAGLTNSPPEIVRVQNKIASGTSVDAGNPAPQLQPAPVPAYPAVFFFNSTTSPTASELLSTQKPLAFISQKSGTGAATQLYDPKADTFLYAVGVSEFGIKTGNGLFAPDTAFFFYDDLFRVAQNFTKGQTVAKFSFPLTVLNADGSENPPVMVTLKVLATCNGGPSCLQAYVYGGGIGTASNPILASQLQIAFALSFGTSPTSTQKHAIFQVGVPLLVTAATDPAYFYFAITGQPGNGSEAGPPFSLPSAGNLATYTVFVDDLLNPVLPLGASLGLAPSAGPLGSPPAAGVSSTFALCASLPDNSDGPAAHLRPAVGAYYAIATDGEMLVSAPLPSVSTSMCPAL